MAEDSYYCIQDYQESHVKDLQTQLNQIKQENEKQKLLNEIEILKMSHSVEKLEMENQLQRLKYEKELQSLMYENQLRTCKNENGKLRQEMDFLLERFRNLEQGKPELNASTANNCTFNSNRYSNTFQIGRQHVLTREARLVEGILKYVERSNFQTNVYDSYVEWYSDVIDRMCMNKEYIYPNHLFICKEFKTFEKWLCFVSKEEDSVYDLQIDTFIADSLNHGWTHQNTKTVFILHPTDPAKFVEFHQDTKSCKEGRIYHSWEVDNVHHELYKMKEKDIGEDKAYILLLCCIKR